MPDIEFRLTAVDEATRSVHCRAYVPNPGLKYRPGLLAQVRVLSRAVHDALVVPRPAVISRLMEPPANRHSQTRTSRATDELYQRKDGKRKGSVPRVLLILRNSDPCTKSQPA